MDSGKADADLEGAGKEQNEGGSRVAHQRVQVQGVAYSDFMSAAAEKIPRARLSIVGLIEIEQRSKTAPTYTECASAGVNNSKFKCEIAKCS